MKKWVSIFIVVLLLFVIVIPSFAQRRKITIWCTDKEVAGIEPLRKKFKKDKKIDVEIEIQAELRSRYISTAKRGGGPDILVGAHDWVGELVKNGLISEINLTQEQIKRYYPLAVKGFTYNGKIYGVPYDFEAVVIYYNKKLIKDVPETWEGLIKVAKNMTKPGEYGFLYSINGNFYTNFPFFGSQGAYIFKEVDNGRYNIQDVGLDNDGGITAGTFIYNNFIKEAVVPYSTGGAIVETYFKDGKVAMVMDGCWNYRSYLTEIGKDNLGIAKLPTLNGKASTPFIGARGFMINNASKSIDFSKNFVLNYIGEKDGQIAMFESGGRPPAHIKAVEEVSIKDPNVQIMINSANDGILMPNVEAMAVVWNYSGGMIDKFCSGETTVTNSLKTVCNTIRSEISRNADRY